MAVPHFDSLVKNESNLRDLANNAKDYALNHGLCMRLHGERYDEDSLTFSPFMLFPTPFPREEFQNLTALQPIINKMLIRVQDDKEFLTEALKDVIKVDDFTAKLFQIYEKVKSKDVVQSVNVGIIRTDYMLDLCPSSGVDSDFCACKQVEMNTMAVGIAIMGSMTSQLHKYTMSCIGNTEDMVGNLPENSAFQGVVDVIVEGWKMYGNPDALILFVITEVAYLISDRRLIEFEIKKQNPQINIISKALTEIARDARLTDDRRLIVEENEIALVYHRSCFSPTMYTGEADWNARLMMERSSAIKLPSIGLQLAGTKKVQQHLSLPGMVEQFLSAQEAKMVRRTFTRLYAFNTIEGMEARAKALENPHDFVIKPQREGGMDGIFGSVVTKFLNDTESSEESNGYIMMDRICPPARENWLVKPHHQMSKVECTQELGIFGTFIIDAQKGINVNKSVGHVLRSKLKDVDEGEITGEITTAGSDSVYLVDMKKCMEPECKYASDKEQVKCI